MSYSSDRPRFGAQAGAQAGAAPYGPPWGPAWGRFAGWDSPFANELLANRPLRIALVVLAFIFWWPVGLATLLFMLWSRRMGCWKNGGRMFRQNGNGDAGSSPWARSDKAPPSSGNRAFDEYRQETLRRLEDEQRDFVGFLDRLRYAKDKAEFDQFLAERRQRSESPPANPPPQPDQPQNA